MALFLGIFHLLVLSLAVSAQQCTSPGQRKAWHKLTNAEKTAYIDAELCLMKKPATLGLRGAKTRFDEFQSIHQLQAYSTHFVGSFLPFHRLMLYAHETALRNECGYTGYQPYWQEQLDAGRFSRSTILDPVYGFGGDGARTTGCVSNGPFANYTNSLGPGYEITNHCINRRINDAISSGSAQAYVDACLAMRDFETAWPCIEGQPHTGGHAGIGGQMGNGVSSPGDPLFYLHHTWLDKIFWDWQAKDRATRVKRIAGTNIGPDFAPGFPPRPATIPKPTGAAGDPGTVTTLNHVLNMYGNSPNKTIGDVLDIQGSYLCYEYVEP